MADQKPSQARPEFFVEARRDKKASEEAGRPIFKDVEMVRVRFAGDAKRELVAPAHEKFKLAPGGGHMLSYAEVWPDHYEAFKKGHDALASGTLIDLLPGLRPSQIAAFKAQGVPTIEALAALPDRTIAKIGPGTRDLVEQARAYLDEAHDRAAASAARAESDALKARVAELEALIAGKAGTPQKGDDVSAMSDDELRAFLNDRGISPRANASREKLEAAVRDVMASEAEAA